VNETVYLSIWVTAFDGDLRSAGPGRAHRGKAITQPKIPVVGIGYIGSGKLTAVYRRNVLEIDILSDMNNKSIDVRSRIIPSLLPGRPPRSPEDGN